MTYLRPTIAACAVFCAVVFASCSAQQNPTSLCIEVGKTYTWSLPGNATTGYMWKLATLPANSCVKIVEDTYTLSHAKDGRVGAGGEHSFVIEGKALGTIVLTAQYQRAWEKEPIETKTLTIQVAPAK